MSILIKGLKMPKNCMECQFKGFDRAKGRGNICTIDETITLHAVLDGLDVKFVNVGDCPLVPVPDHGDLIDRDALFDDNSWDWFNEWGSTVNKQAELVADAPVVIPAERSESDD